MKRWLSVGIFALLFGFETIAQQHYYHNILWGRLALNDTINSKVRWELFLQHRRQNALDNELDVVRSPQFTSYWAWIHYSLSPTTKLSVSPFGYFKSWILIAHPSDLDKEGIRELRWCVRVDQEQKFSWINLLNRYSLEYRWRDLANNNVFLPNWRIRYMLRLEKPLKIDRLKFPVSLVLNNEIFIQFGRAVRGNPNIFDQNRLYAGINAGVAKNVKVSLGYIYGIQQRNSGREIDYSNILWAVLTFDNVLSQFRASKQKRS